jgi:hypothetical protein
VKEASILMTCEMIESVFAHQERDNTAAAERAHIERRMTHALQIQPGQMSEGQRQFSDALRNHQSRGYSTPSQQRSGRKSAGFFSIDTSGRK